MTLDNLVVIVKCLKESLEEAERKEAKEEAEYKLLQDGDITEDKLLREAYGKIIKAREWRQDIEAAMSAVRTHEWI